MITSNEIIYDRLIRHQIYLRKYSGTVRNKILKLLDKNMDDLWSVLGDASSGTGEGPGDLPLKRKTELLRNVEAIRSQGFKSVAKQLETDMVEFAKYETGYTINLYSKVTPVRYSYVVPSPEKLRAIALLEPFEGEKLNKWLKNIQRDDLGKIKSAIQYGMTQGEGTDVIRARLRGGLLRYSPARGGEKFLTQTHLESIIRTSINSISNKARKEVAISNRDIFDEEVFFSTLDARTTFECAALDGRKFKIGQGKEPPLHFNCRSVRIPFLDRDTVGKRPSIPVTRKMALRKFSGRHNIKSIHELDPSSKNAFIRFERGFKRDLTGRAPRVKTYNEWLKNTSKEYQDDYLGVGRAKLFREGKLEMKDFVDDGKTLSLEELKYKDKAYG